MRRLLAVGFALVLAGCGSIPGPTRAPQRPASVVAPSTAELAAARVAAGISDCPDADASATAVTGGLPATTLGCLGSDRTVNLAGLRGRPMVVNLWAQWCLPCRQEAPHLREAAERLGDDVDFLGVDYEDPRPDWAIEFAGLAGWRYPHVTDPTRSLAGPLRVQGIPTTLFVDAQGRIVGRQAGPFASASELEDLATRYFGVTP